MERVEIMGISDNDEKSPMTYAQAVGGRSSARTTVVRLDSTVSDTVAKLLVTTRSPKSLTTTHLPDVDTAKI